MAGRSRRGHLDHLDPDVVAAEARDGAHGAGKSELRDDVVLHQRRGRGGEGDDRRRTQQRQALAEHAVIRPEVVSPLRDAVRLVDRDQRRCALGEHLGKARHAQALGCDEQKVERAREVVETNLPRRRAVAPGMDALGAKALLAELRHLVFHQRDQRADHQRGAAARDPGKLVAERLARAGGHHEQHVLAAGERLADLLLVRPEGREAELLAEHRSEIAAGRDRGLCGGVRMRRGRRGRGGLRGALACGLAAHTPHHLANVLLDPFEKRRERCVPAPNSLQTRLPTARSSPGS